VFAQAQAAILSNTDAPPPPLSRLVLDYLRVVPDTRNFALLLQLTGAEEKAGLDACFAWLLDCATSAAHPSAAEGTVEDNEIDSASVRITEEEVRAVGALYSEICSFGM